jgi:tryptophanase
MTAIRIQIARDVLEAATANNDEMVIAACRRVINAYYIGRDRELKADWAIIKAFAE